jgi:hypothetical protein
VVTATNSQPLIMLTWMICAGSLTSNSTALSEKSIHAPANSA